VSAEERFEPERVVEALNRMGVRYVVVGGLAAGAHGVVRATRDIDLVPDPDPDNLERLASTLVSLGGRHVVHDDLTGENLAAPVSMKVRTEHGEVHVLSRMPGTPSFHELDSERLLVEVAPGVEAPVCSLAHLRRMKLASERPRDVVDLVELDELHGPDDSSS
jgi:hypothetical protein